MVVESNLKATAYLGNNNSSFKKMDTQRHSLRESYTEEGVSHIFRESWKEEACHTLRRGSISISYFEKEKERHTLLES